MLKTMTDTFASMPSNANNVASQRVTTRSSATHESDGANVCVRVIYLMRFMLSLYCVFVRFFLVFRRCVFIALILCVFYIQSIIFT